MSTAKHDKDTSNSTKLTDNDTSKVINQTFDDAKNKARKAMMRHIENYHGICRQSPIIKNRR